MNWREIYLEIAPEDIAYIKFILESYEGVGIIRTVDRKQAIIVLLATDSFLATARELVTALKQEIGLAEVARPAGIGDDWLMRELATEP
ncbi:MAG: DUF4911 domain-containing protein [Candidatus Binatia bacterium]